MITICFISIVLTVVITYKETVTTPTVNKVNFINVLVSVHYFQHRIYKQHVVLHLVPISVLSKIRLI